MSAIDAKYGKGAGKNVVKLTIIASAIFICICLAIMGIVKHIDRTTLFELDNEDKIAERRDSKNEKREKMADIKTDYDKLEETIKDVIEKGETPQMSEAESTELYNQNIQSRYYIKDYKGNIYYANDKEDILEIRELLD